MTTTRPSPAARTPAAPPPARRGRRPHLAAALVLLLAACAADTLRPPAEPPGTSRHVVSSGRLRTIMQGLERLRVDRLPQELDTTALLARRLDALAEAGDALAAAAVDVAAAADDLDLDPANRRLFLTMAAELRRRALTLRSRAAEGNLDDATAAYADLTATCDSCHALYRGR